MGIKNYIRINAYLSISAIGILLLVACAAISIPASRIAPAQEEMSVRKLTLTPTARSTPQRIQFNNIVSFPTSPEIHPHDVFDQVVFSGTGGGSGDPGVAKFKDDLKLSKFSPNQVLRILVYKYDKEIFLMGEYITEWTVKVDNDGNLTLHIPKGSFNEYGYIVIDAKNGKVIYPKFFSCPDIEHSRLEVGSGARVTITNGIPLRLRKSPEILPNNTIVQIEEGTQMDVIDGPACGSNHYLWWKVIVDRKTGWMMAKSRRLTRLLGDS